MSLLEKLKKTSTVKQSEVLSESKLFNLKDVATTPVPIVNVALSGSVDGGLTSGLTILAGPSKHFKSNLALMLAASYMKKHEDAVCLLYDTEFGITPEYLKAMNVDPERCLHTPIEHVEQLKFDISKQLEAMERGDKVIIVLDSVGNLASKKELEDALDGKAVADMTRAKALKSLFRIVTPYLTTRDIPMLVINHTIQTIEMFSKQVMTGGTGLMYSANTVLFLGKSQEKEGSDVVGYNFTINIEKSRYVKEKSKLPFTVTWEHGINRWSGLLDVGLSLGWIRKPAVGWFEGVNPETGEVLTDKKRRKDTDNAEFWLPVLKGGYATALNKNYAIGHVQAITDEGDNDAS
ncbi:MAG: recombinase RecA [Candidatus Thiodiazotropha endolucinida]|uniref:Protein RecA n=1 Tax=Candidatus Thiodiazotropha taylori TaxID=2792791 RepID=A0A9E4N3F1_9GAMM|nr:recombinase RecA [Candidatus Thiodiazotropha taylori]